MIDDKMTLADATLTRAFFSAIKSRESEHVRSSESEQQEGHDRSQVPSSQLSRELGFRATLLCRSRDFVKSSAERAHRWTWDAYRARGIVWTLFMRRERGPRLDMELVHGSGKGVGEEKSGTRGTKRSVAVFTLYKFESGFTICYLLIIRLRRS